MISELVVSSHLTAPSRLSTPSSLRRSEVAAAGTKLLLIATVPPPEPSTCADMVNSSPAFSAVTVSAPVLADATKPYPAPYSASKRVFAAVARSLTVVLLLVLNGALIEVGTPR